IAFGESKIVLEEVKVVEPANCTVTGDTGIVGTVPTKKMSIHGDWMDTHTANQHAFLQFIPLEGGAFFQFELGGTGCAAFSGKKNLTGSLFAESKVNTNESSVKQELVFSRLVQETSGASLLLGTKPATLSATGAFELSTKELFSIK
ncbi:MAG TPA: hypothetical protein VGI17_01140, partial [Solirubrobacterales bacterium]